MKRDKWNERLMQAREMKIYLPVHVVWYHAAFLLCPELIFSFLVFKIKQELLAV